jgi:hypothetical protein
MHLHESHLKICRHVLLMELFPTTSVWCSFIRTVFTCEMNFNCIPPYTLLFLPFEHQVDAVVSLGIGRI